MNTLDELKADKLAAEEEIRDILNRLYEKYRCNIELNGSSYKTNIEARKTISKIRFDL